jgi:hypothetical protein
LANEIYLGSARFLRQLSSLQRGSTGEELDVTTVVVADCRPDVTIVVVTVCKFDEIGAAIVDPNRLLVVEELVALCSLEKELVDMKYPVDALGLGKTVLLEDSRLEEATLL